MLFPEFQFFKINIKKNSFAVISLLFVDYLCYYLFVRYGHLRIIYGVLIIEN